MFFGFNVFDPKNSPAINTQQEAYKSKFTAVSGPPLALSPRLQLPTSAKCIWITHPFSNPLPTPPSAPFSGAFKGMPRRLANARAGSTVCSGCEEVEGIKRNGQEPCDVRALDSLPPSLPTYLYLTTYLTTYLPTYLPLPNYLPTYLPTSVLSPSFCLLPPNPSFFLSLPVCPISPSPFRTGTHPLGLDLML